MNIDFSGKRALVTGASRGIGAAIFSELGAAGAAVAGTATSAAGAGAISDSASRLGFRGAGFAYDAASAAQAGDLATQAAEFLGGAPDILVCNAGMAADSLMMRMKDEAWSKVLDANLSGAFYLARAVLPSMLKNRSGRIIAVSSVVASMGNAGQANYCAAKAGLEGLVRALARESASRGVTVNAVAPGFIETDMTASLPEGVRERILAAVPQARIGDPADVAAAVLFLASERAAYITGQTMHVNGGMLMG